MNKYAVVLNWSTETDTGYSPVLVAVNANSPEEALQIALNQASSGELFRKIYNLKDDEEFEEMDIHEDSSFATTVDSLFFIN
jgi:hypothetical protein